MAVQGDAGRDRAPDRSRQQWVPCTGRGRRCRKPVFPRRRPAREATLLGRLAEFVNAAAQSAAMSSSGVTTAAPNLPTTTPAARLASQAMRLCLTCCLG